MTNMRIIKLVDKLVTKYETNDPFIICDKLNIEINYKYLGNSKGYYTYNNCMCVVYINKVIEHYEKRAICAHELGHALLHTNTNIRFMSECTFFSINRYEREANYFAANFLLYNIYNHITEYKDYSLMEIALTEGVPIEYVQQKWQYSYVRKGV